MKLTELEHLKLQNITLRHALISKEKEDLTREFVAKYGQPGDQGVKIESDGTVTRVPAKLESVPPTSEIDHKSA